LPQRARLDEPSDAEQAHRQPDLHQLPCREARPAAVGARAGGRGLHAVPHRARLRATRAADQEPPAAVPAMPRRGGPSFSRTHRRCLAGQRRRGRSLRRRGQLHQLPHAGARVQPSCGREAAAMKPRTDTTMRTSTPLWLLAALGALSITIGAPAWAADPSQWTCESCPFEEAGTHGTVDAGVGAVSDDSAKFGVFSGLNRNGAFAIAVGAARYRGKDGMVGSVTASDLGLDTRALAAELGREGRYTVQLGYAELPRHLSTGAMTPFIGSGGSVLTLPTGFPAADTASMPLAGTLQPVDTRYKRTRLDLGAQLIGSDHWSYRVN